MKSPILILFIILNLLSVNLVSAMNIYNEDTSESHLVHEQTSSTQDVVLASCVDESSCDHFCHISAHMVGFITQITQITTVNTVVSSSVLIEQFHSLTLDPPYQPPQA
jgi:hypothetical protein